MIIDFSAEVYTTAGNEYGPSGRQDFDTYIGEFPYAEALLKELDFPEELVLNRSVSEIAKYVNRRLEE